MPREIARVNFPYKLVILARWKRKSEEISVMCQGENEGGKSVQLAGFADNHLHQLLAGRHVAAGVQGSECSN